MSLMDKVVGAVAPPESDEKRREAGDDKQYW